MESDYVKLKEVKPALSGYIREAESLLKAAEFPDEKVVHEVRVLLKKARAVLRITASQLEKDFTTRENLALREAGRKMSSWRDTTVLRKTLRVLKKSHPDIFTKIESNDRINEILKKPETKKIPSEDESNALNDILEILNKSGYRMRFEPMSGLDAQLLLQDLEVTYSRVVNSYLICRNYPKTSTLHEFRKSSKDFLYQLWFFRPLNISVVKSLEKKLDSMTQNLGKYNDLARLLKELGYKYEYTSNPPALDELGVIIREEQDRYLSKVWPVSYKIFCPGQNLVNILGFKLLLI